MEPLRKQKEPQSHQRSKLVLRVMPFDLRNLWWSWCKDKEMPTYHNVPDLFAKPPPKKKYDSHLLD